LHSALPITFQSSVKFLVSLCNLGFFILEIPFIALLDLEVFNKVILNLLHLSRDVLVLKVNPSSKSHSRAMFILSLDHVAQICLCIGVILLKRLKSVENALLGVVPQFKSNRIYFQVVCFVPNSVVHSSAVLIKRFS
jgi:hypothetical protein